MNPSNPQVSILQYLAHWGDFWLLINQLVSVMAHMKAKTLPNDV